MFFPDLKTHDGVDIKNSLPINSSNELKGTFPPVLSKLSKLSKAVISVNKAQIEVISSKYSVSTNSTNSTAQGDKYLSVFEELMGREKRYSYSC